MGINFPKYILIYEHNKLIKTKDVRGWSLEQMLDFAEKQEEQGRDWKPVENLPSSATSQGVDAVEGDPLSTPLPKGNVTGI